METSSKPRITECPSCKKPILELLELGTTIGATQLQGCPHCGVVFIILPYSNDSKDDSPFALPVGEKVMDVFSRLDKLRGYRPPKRKAEAASIIRMLKTYTPDQIITAWETLKQDKFWQNKELFMMIVESQIGAILKNVSHQRRPQGFGDTKTNSTKDSRRNYTDGKYGAIVRH